MIIHPESCSVLFKLKHPELVRKVLPKGSKDININGHNIAVRFTLDAMKVLRNMGIKAPLPIRYNYGWPRPAHFKDVFEHQIITAEMLTLHHRMFVLNEMGCVDANTEYLSPTGWRRIADYDGGMVTQYDERTGEGSFVQPTEYVKYPCGEMIRFKTSRGVDQLLSTEHRVAYVGSTGRFAVQSAQEIESAYFQSGRGWSGRFITSFTGVGGTGMPDSDVQLRLQVAVIADGHFGKPTNWCVVRIKKERKKTRLRELLDACGVAYKETMPEYTGAEGFSVFRFNAPVREKEFGTRWWSASPAQLSVVVDEVWRWDGSARKAEAVDFCSTSKASADFAQYAFSACGQTATMGTTLGGRKRPLYAVHAQKGGKLRYLKGATSSGAKKQNVWREPSPDGFKYCFEVPKTFLIMRRNGCVFVTGNTSKTASALWAADYLMLNGFVGKCLIVAPLSTLDLVWANEIFSVLMHRTCAVLHGSREKRLELLARDFPFYIINHDGLKIIQSELRRRKDINLIIVDESSVYRNSGTDRYEVLEKSIQPWHRLWLMTGAPCPNAPTDAWAQVRLVNPSRVPKYFGQFRRQTMYQVTQYKWAARPEAYQTVFDAMQPAVRFKKSECLSLPPVTVTNRQSKITAEQAAAFHAMKKEAAAEVAAGIPIMAANAADKINKLRQILCGVVKDTATGNYVEIPHHPRIETLMECIEQAAAKVLVIVPFKGIIHAIHREVSKTWKCAVVNGDVSRVARTAIFNQFKNDPDLKVLLCHPKVMAHGITATEADMIVFYAPIYSNDEAQQVTERINRPGQTRNMTIVRIGASSVEWAIYNMVEGKRVGQESILELYKKELQGIG